MTKCTLCVDRIYDELLPPQDRKPACVKACPTGARLFGDVKDPDSDVSKAIRERGGYQLMPEWDTQPANHYLPRKVAEAPRNRNVEFRLSDFINATSSGARKSSASPQEAIAGAFLLWYCTAMIYACIRFIQEWAHPLTIVNYVTLGLASGLITSGALAIAAGEVELLAKLGGWALAATAVAWFTRTLSLRRNSRLKPQSTVQSATGINSGRVVQKSMGMTGGSFNTREFFHGASMRMFRAAKFGFQLLAFGLPILLLAWAVVAEYTFAWLLAFISQALGLLAERWFFFAQARHPRNIYYQVVS